MTYELIVAFISGGVLASLSLFLYLRSQQKEAFRARQEAKELAEKMQQDLEKERRLALTKLKDEIHKKRSDFELEIKKTRIEQQRALHKYQKKLDALDRREELLDDLRSELQKKERDVSRRLDGLMSDEARLKKVYEDLLHKLEKVSSMTRDEAKRVMFDSLEQEVKLESQQWIAKVEEETRCCAKEKATDLLATAMQRYLPEQVTLHSSSVITLPNEEMKGRIIGKEGRNIKALEMATGMEFVIGDIPEIITISGFNPIRREVAKRTLNKLIADGRINPTRIEETVEEVEKEMDQTIAEMGNQTILEFGFRGVHEEIVKLLGMLHFRTSFTQNVLLHCKEVAYFARMIAAELGLDENLAARCGLLHDIGKAVSAEVEGPHAIIGGDLAKKYGEKDTVINAIAAHHNEVPPKTIYSLITQIADAISASRPGARRETLSTYVKRLEQLEEISQAFSGVKKAYALQAGREIRVIVDESSLDDEKSSMLARDIAKKIESEMNFPGQIKVNVIREKRIIEYAR